MRREPTPPMPAYAVLGSIIISVVVLNALITLAVEVLFLPTYLGTVAVPISAVAAGAANVALVLGVGTVTGRVGLLVLPVTAWAFGFLLCATTGPGGDILLGSDWCTLLLLVCGLAPPLLYIYSRHPRRGLSAAPTSG